MKTVSGGCLCGAVRVEAAGEPLRVGLCHCLDCRKHHGAVFHASAIFDAVAVRVEGETRGWEGRHFCPRCGSSVFSRTGDEMEVHLGALDAPDRFVPTYELWTERREGWLPVLAMARFSRDREVAPETTGPDPGAIRRLGPGDLDLFRELRLEALATDGEVFASTYEHSRAMSDAEWTERLTDGVVMAAFDGSEAVALGGYLRQRPDKMAHRAMLVMIWVRPGARGRGLAEALVAALEADAAAEGVRRMELAVTVENAGALRLYERLGYERAGVIPGGFCHEGRDIDEVVMVKRVK